MTTLLQWGWAHIVCWYYRRALASLVKQGRKFSFAWTEAFWEHNAAVNRILQLEERFRGR